MFSLFNKIKIWFRGLKKKNVSYVPVGIEPGHDWLMVLAGLFFGLCVAGVIAFYFYTGINNGTLFTVAVEDGGEQIHIDTKLMKKTIDDITIRRGASDFFSKNALNFPDPSL